MDVSQLQVTIGADISDFEDAIDNMLTALDNVAESIQTMANNFIEASSHISTSGGDMSDTIGKVGGAFLSTISVGAILSTSFFGLTKVSENFNKALKSNPISLIVSLIAALAAVVIECYYKFDTFRAIVNASWAILKDTAVIIGGALVGSFKILYDIVSWVADVFKDLGNILSVLVVAPFMLIIDAVKALYYATVGLDWSKAWDAIKELGTDAKDAAMKIKDSAVDIAKSTGDMADSVKKDFVDSAAQISDTASGMSDDISKAYESAFEKTKTVNDTKVKIDKVTITPNTVKLNTDNNKVETKEIKKQPSNSLDLKSASMSSIPSTSSNVDSQMAVVYPQLAQDAEKYKLAQMEANEATQESIQLNNELQSVASGAFSTLGDALGKMIAGQKNVNPLAALMKQMGDALKKYGEFIITAGTAMLFGGDPMGAAKVGEGVALVTVGSAMGSVKMAQGGIVSGSTFANIGEYAGASHNPEVVAPLDKLRNMMGSGNHNMHYSFEMMGDKMVSAMQRQSDNNNFILGTNNQ